MEFGTNIWMELDPEGDVAGDDGVRGKRLERIRGETLAVALWELDPGATAGPYHFHHGSMETLIVLRGRPTLRTPDGERELEAGDVVHFRRGPDGAHQTANKSDSVVRYLMIAWHPTPEIIEYPDDGTLAVMALTDSQLGEPLFAFYRVGDAFMREGPS